jgi:hypothetical protein
MAYADELPQRSEFSDHQIQENCRVGNYMERLSGMPTGFHPMSEMVHTFKKKGGAVYLCELCGFGYEHLETVELCEQYCNIHGSYSPEITERAVHKPSVHVISVAA